MTDPEGNSPASARPPASAAPAAAPRGGRWERDVLERLAFAALREQRSARRWGIFFKFALLAYGILLLVVYLPVGDLFRPDPGKHTALVNVEGVIAGDADASADNVITAMRAAFEDEDTAGVILRINSPGGSPVQAGYINDEIKRLREKHPDIPLYAVITDICASGGYYVAAAADKIYADKSSLLGSIGVLINGFGFVETMEKLGVERRLLTAGDFKGMLDPFSPENPRVVAHLNEMLAELHARFIEVVKQGRGDRLADDPTLFSGLMWTGEQGVELGLVDALGSSSAVARDVVGAKTIVDFTVRRGYLERITERFGAALGRAAVRRLGLESRLVY